MEVTDFDSGFDGSTPTQVEEPAPEAPEAPKYVQITEDDLKQLQAGVAGLAEIRETMGKRFDTAFGKLGGVERTLSQLTSAPTGIAVELNDDIVSDMAEDFPELAAAQLKTLQKFAQTIKMPAAVAPTSPSVDIEEQLQSRIIALETEALEDEYPDWRNTVGGPDSNTEYRKWLSTQDAAYQQRLNTTNSAAIISRSISKFLATNKPKPSARQSVIRDAVTPQGDGGNPTGTSAIDEFNAGFAGK
jgi:hypothetical protein